MDPMTASVFVRRLTVAHDVATSAMPDAPQVVDRPGPVRTALAGGFRRLAVRLDPSTTATGAGIPTQPGAPRLARTSAC
ncbi:hypothetical protein [Egicoccus sp. AB-alg2]|uniref:hypothetical protein n=1 Tax=Egicoccus sp. AB-alg2 TaxID=3242693 RepID=UPI00359CC48D